MLFLGPHALPGERTSCEASVSFQGLSQVVFTQWQSVRHSFEQINLVFDPSWAVMCRSKFLGQPVTDRYTSFFELHTPGSAMACAARP